MGDFISTALIRGSGFAKLRTGFAKLSNDRVLPKTRVALSWAGLLIWFSKLTADSGTRFTGQWGAPRPTVRA